MIRHIVESRSYLSLILTVGIGTLLTKHFPFSDDNAVLQLVAVEKPMIFLGVKYAYQAMLFSTPFIGCSMLFSTSFTYSSFDRAKSRRSRRFHHIRKSANGNGFSWLSVSCTIRSARNLPRSRAG